jgi:adenylate kinase
MQHISTGDLFRDAMKQQTPLGVEAKRFVDAGQLVPDSVTVGMVREALARLSPSGEFILDGFPRTVAQATALESLLSEIGRPLGRAVFIEVPREELLGRLTGRRVCTGCGAVYHLQSKPSKVAGVCDLCGGTVVQRKDDSQAVIGTRLTAYDQSTAPLKDHYAKQGLLKVVDGLGEASDVFARMQTCLLESR